MAMHRDPQVIPLKPVRYEPPEETFYARPCVIFDFDGTLIDNFHIRHGKGFKTSQCWPAIQGQFEYERARLAGYKVVVVTVRSEFWRKTTEKWLAAHGFDHDGLYMRRVFDSRNDVAVKNDLHDRLYEDDFVPIRAVEDNPLIAKLWESHGIETILVGGSA